MYILVNDHQMMVYHNGHFAIDYPDVMRVIGCCIMSVMIESVMIESYIYRVLR